MIPSPTAPTSQTFSPAASLAVAGMASAPGTGSPCTTLGVSRDQLARCIVVVEHGITISLLLDAVAVGIVAIGRDDLRRARCRRS